MSVIDDCTVGKLELQRGYRRRRQMGIRYGSVRNTVLCVNTLIHQPTAGLAEGWRNIKRPQSRCALLAGVAITPKFQPQIFMVSREESLMVPWKSFLGREAKPFVNQQKREAPNPTVRWLLLLRRQPTASEFPPASGSANCRPCTEAKEAVDSST